MSDSHGPWGPEKPPDPPRRPVRASPRLGLALWLGLLALCVGLVVGLALLMPGQTPNGQDAFRVLRLVGLAALVSSGLVAARRINMAQAARYALAWAGILILLALLYQDRADVLDLGKRMASAFAPAQPIIVHPPVAPAQAAADTSSAIEMQIGRSDSGGFYVMGEVNGEPVRFLIDTGSSEIVLSPEDAARAHLPTGGEAKPAETANGVASGSMATADSLAVGPLRLTSVPVFVNRAPISVSLLGLAFLDHLESYEVRGDRMVLRSKPSS
jgi:aspartyl protease family protein